MALRILPGTRKIPKSKSNVTGDIMRLGYESPLERDFVTVLLFDEDVEELQTQPPKIEYLDDKGKKHTYTADLFARFRNRIPLLAEVKPEKELVRKRAEYQPKFDAAQAYCETMGWQFEVYSEDRIRKERLKNVRFLWQHHMARDKPLPPLATPILEAFAKRGGEPATMAQVLEPLYPDPTTRGGAIWAWWSLVARKMLLCDLDVLLTPETLYVPAKPPP